MNWFRVALSRLCAQPVVSSPPSPGPPTISLVPDTPSDRPWLYTTDRRLAQLEVLGNSRLRVIISDETGRGQVEIGGVNFGRVKFAGWGEFPDDAVPRLGDVLPSNAPSSDSSQAPPCTLEVTGVSSQPPPTHPARVSTLLVMVVLNGQWAASNVYLVVRWIGWGRLSVDRVHHDESANRDYALTEAGFYRGDYDSTKYQLTLRGRQGQHTTNAHLCSRLLPEVSNTGFTFTPGIGSGTTFVGVVNGQFFEYRTNDVIYRDKYTLDRHYLVYLTSDNHLSVVDVRDGRVVVPGFRIYYVTTPLGYDDLTRSVIVTTPFGIDAIKGEHQVRSVQAQQLGVRVERELFHQWLPWSRRLVIQYDRIAFLRLIYVEVGDGKQGQLALDRWTRRSRPPPPRP